MELILNLVWGLLAIASICLWARADSRKGTERCLSVIALSMLIIIMFPVISVSDDLWSIQNPAETDSFQRRDHLAPLPHSIFPSLAMLCEVGPAEMSVGFGNWMVWANPAIAAQPVPPPAGIQNRPPPAA